MARSSPKRAAAAAAKQHAAEASAHVASPTASNATSLAAAGPTSAATPSSASGTAAGSPLLSHHTLATQTLLDGLTSFQHPPPSSPFTGHQLAAADIATPTTPTRRAMGAGGSATTASGTAASGLTGGATPGYGATATTPSLTDTTGHATLHDPRAHGPGGLLLGSTAKSPSAAAKHAHASHDHGHAHDHGDGGCSRRSDGRTPFVPSSSCAGMSDMDAPKMSPENRAARRKLWIATGLCFAFFCVELVAGIWSGSLAILSDSFHLLSDIAGFGISLTALYLSSQPATDRHSFGFHRAEIIGAVVSTFLIWVLTAGLLYEAVNRLRDPQPIDGKIMFITAAIGVGVNLLLGATLHGDHGHGHGGHDHGGHSHGGHSHGGHSHDVEAAHAHDHDHEGHGHDDEGATAATPLITNPAPKILNINVHSAAIHVIGDLLSSIGVLISAGIIWYDPTKTMVDPICTFIFSIFVVLTTVRLMSNSFSVLMEGTPAHIDPAAVLQDLRAVPGVTDVHDLHIWSMTVGQVALVAHVQIAATGRGFALDAAAAVAPSSQALVLGSQAVTPTVGESFSADVYNEVLLKCREIVCVKYAIHHSTIQIDVGPDDHCNPRMCRR